jgi:hypothetical protein
MHCTLLQNEEDRRKYARQFLEMLGTRINEFVAGLPAG